MKKLNWSLSFAVAALLAVSFYGCSDSVEVTGTAEDPNELAIVESSSSLVVYSSSEEESSSSESSSSSEKGVTQPESSDANDKARSSSSCTLEESSSSQETLSSSSLSSSSLSSSSVVESSSSKAPPQGGINSSCSTVKQNSLDYYVEVLGLNRNQVYEGVMAARSKEEMDFDTGPGEGMATEFDGPWPHPFVKQNLPALEYFFPDAAEEYAELIESIKAGTADENCRLYMLNVDGNANTLGFVIADVAEEVVTVLDIGVGECPNSTDGKTVRFLFYHCGKIDSRPEIRHVEVDGNIPQEMCPEFKDDSEWVK